MSGFTFLFNRKGALYPIDFSVFNSITENTTPNNANLNSDYETNSEHNLNNRQAQQKITSEWPFNSINDSSLVHLCSKVIVSMPTSEIDRITNLIPAELFIPLFKASLYPVKDNAIDVSLIK